jgi:hypothetical protein
MTLLHILSLLAFFVFPLLLIRICTMLATLRAAIDRFTAVTTVLTALLAAKDAEILNLKARIEELSGTAVDPVELNTLETDALSAVAALEALVIPEAALAA